VLPEVARQKSGARERSASLFPFSPFSPDDLDLSEQNRTRTSIYLYGGCIQVGLMLSRREGRGAKGALMPSGWKIEYLPEPGGAPVLSREKPTCEAAVSRAVNLARRNEPVAIHGPEGPSIRGDELKALLAEAARLRATRRRGR
jgi:hypothetical protein